MLAKVEESSRSHGKGRIQIKDERVLKDLTIVGYFDDPIIHFALKELINMPENKNLLLLYEASLPSWTVILA